jgi:hypothetical protein
VRLCPSEAEAHLQVSGLGRVVVRSRIFGDIEPRDADRAARANHIHRRIEHRSWSLFAFLTLRSGFEAHRVHGGIDFGLADYIRDQLTQFVALRQVDRGEADTDGVLAASRSQLHACPLAQ